MQLEMRPPFVRFETRAEEDRTASQEAGHFVAQDVDYALITPAGSKDCIERVVSEWFLQLDAAVRDEPPRFKSEWLTQYKEAYKAFRENREAPVNGTSVRLWPAASPAQVAVLLRANLHTVEDLAVANEQALSMLGMGGRALRDKAIAWLDSSANVGRTAEQLVKLQAANDNLQERNEVLTKQLAALMARLDQLEAKPAVKKL